MLLYQGVIFRFFKRSALGSQTPSKAACEENYWKQSFMNGRQRSQERDLLSGIVTDFLPFYGNVHVVGEPSVLLCWGGRSDEWLASWQDRYIPLGAVVLLKWMLIVLFCMCSCIMFCTSNEFFKGYCYYCMSSCFCSFIPSRWLCSVCITKQAWTFHQPNPRLKQGMPAWICGLCSLN